MSASGGLRITGGEHRGRKIPLPKHHELRPTSEKARQAFFDIVGPAVEDSSFLDLFSGTGVFALEALSRGAKRALAVDSSRRAVEQIRSTATTLGVPADVIFADVYRSTEKLKAAGEFDLVYADPPYGDDRWAELLATISSVLAPDGLAAVEHWVSNIDQIPASGADLVRTRVAKYGTVAISLFARAETQ